MKRIVAVMEMSHLGDEQHGAVETEKTYCVTFSSAHAWKCLSRASERHTDECRYVRAVGDGDPTQYDGLERFRDTYRHIVQIARQEGACNITWVFHVNDDDDPNLPWNSIQQYYPGDAWVDWIGVSLYGMQLPTETNWILFGDRMEPAYNRIAALSPTKPLVLLEFGVTSESPLGDQAVWADQAFQDLFGTNRQRLIGFACWNETWLNQDGSRTDMRVQDNPNLAATFQQWVGNSDRVLSRITDSNCLPLVTR